MRKCRVVAASVHDGKYRICDALRINTYTCLDNNIHNIIESLSMLTIT